MVATAHLDHDDDLARWPSMETLAKPNNVIGKKGDGVGAEREFGKRFIHLDRAEDRHPDSGQREDHPVERFAEAGRQRHLKARQRVDHQALGVNLLDRVEDRAHGFIHREIQRAEA
jgi:hypothetical protein